MTKPSLSQEEFLGYTRVIRMLYGVDMARKFFEDNFTAFTGYPISVLYKNSEPAKI